jgi:hypothetical protein
LKKTWLYAENPPQKSATRRQTIAMTLCVPAEQRRSLAVNANPCGEIADQIRR